MGGMSVDGVDEREVVVVDATWRSTVGLSSAFSPRIGCLLTQSLP